MNIRPEPSTGCGKTNVWITPRPIVEALGPFDLDPCAADRQPWPTASTQWTEADDGLSRTWFGFVWMNPPYSRTVGIWLDRLAAHGRGIGLVFARTDTEAFFSNVWGRARALFFFRGRIRFHQEDGSVRGQPGAPSLAIAYGGQAAERLDRSNLAGSFVVLPGERFIVIGEVQRTWRHVVGLVLGRHPVRLQEIYALVENHARVKRSKALGHRWRAQVRRTLQEHFRPVERGLWAARA